jgi:hypothetical protein
VRPGPWWRASLATNERTNAQTWTAWKQSSWAIHLQVRYSTHGSIVTPLFLRANTFTARAHRRVLGAPEINPTFSLLPHQFLAHHFHLTVNTYISAKKKGGKKKKKKETRNKKRPGRNGFLLSCTPPAHFTLTTLFICFLLLRSTQHRVPV